MEGSPGCPKGRAGTNHSTQLKRVVILRSVCFSVRRVCLVHLFHMVKDF